MYKDLSITLNLKPLGKSVAKTKEISPSKQLKFKKLKKSCKIVFMHCLY